MVSMVIPVSSFVPLIAIMGVDLFGPVPVDIILDASVPDMTGITISVRMIEYFFAIHIFTNSRPFSAKDIFTRNGAIILSRIKRFTFTSSANMIDGFFAMDERVVKHAPILSDIGFGDISTIYSSSSSSLSSIGSDRSQSLEVSNV